MTTIVFSNQKGGVGKTTLTRLLGIQLASETAVLYPLENGGIRRSSGRKVLLVDCDPQGNLTKSLLEGEVTGLFEALTGLDYEVREIKKDLFLLAGDIRLANLEKSLIGEMDAFTRIKELLREDLFQEFNYILIDTPPSLGILTVNALAAARHLIAPMNPAIYSLQGTNDLMATTARVRKNINPDLAFLGVIINEYDNHPVITRQIREEIQGSFGDLVFRTALSRSVKVEEALAARKGVSAGESKVGDEVSLIAGELVERVELFPASTRETKVRLSSGAEV
jgi:chromosome partitioning protein